MFEINPILRTDSYKFGHHPQYPPKTEKVYSYLESRGSEYDNFHDTVFFGLQYLLDQMAGKIISQHSIDEADEMIKIHLGSSTIFNKQGWQHILDDHSGKLPLSIRAVPEGSIIPLKNVIMTVENTCSKCFWLTNYMETFLVQTWYPITVATLSREMKKLILKFLEETGDPNLISFKLNDFGFRGVSSTESAAIGGAAHLVNFKGTDTFAGILLAKRIYGCPMAGFSIPAAEHSTITSWGIDHEEDAYANMLTQFPEGLVAVVSDSYDIINACRNIWGKKLKDRILSRNGTVIIRPDSGKPEVVVIDVLDSLGEAFGYTINSKGYKVLDPHVRVIQGDGINYNSTRIILGQMKVRGWSTDNVAFGMGGGLLQQLNRDTFRFAFKCSQVVVDGKERDVFKQPATDPGKNSKRGRLKLVKIGSEYKTVPAIDYSKLGNNGTYPIECDYPDELVEVFRNGEILKKWTLDEIRERASIKESILI